MINFLETSYHALASAQFLLAAILISISVKTYFLGKLIPQGLRSAKIQRPWWFLLGILAGSLFGDIAWIVKLLRKFWFPDSHYTIITFFIRIAWGFLIIQYQALALFIESLTEKHFKLGRFHKIMLLVSGSFSLYFFYLAFFDHTLTDELERERAKEFIGSIPVEISIMRYAIYYLFNLLLIPSLYVTFKKLRTANLPHILRKQLRIFLQFLITPYILVEFLQAAHFLFQSFESYLYPTVSISTILLIYALYYCMQRVMGLRFLNFNNHVQSEHNFSFIDDFKNVFEQLSYTSSTQELGHIVQTFFKDAFNIPTRKTQIYIRELDGAKQSEQKNHGTSKTEHTIEQFLNTHEGPTCTFIRKHKILIYDEIAFSNFYDEDATQITILDFLDHIGADIFLPIYDKQKIIAYVIVERHARHKEFYSNVERDEMLVFASYLGNVLNLLKNRNVETFIHQEKELKEELYASHQEMNQYKESIRSFLRNAKYKEIGIIFYKNRRFVFGNQAAKELIKININNQEGHPLTQSLKTVARQVEEYKSPQTCFAKDTSGNKLVLSGVPNLEHNNVIITIYYPEISDILTKQIMLLKDPSKWDYLLYLETTQAGQLINQLIPGSGETLLHFKINFLKIALSKKAVFLEFPEEDITSTVELLHHISVRETLHTVNLQAQEKNLEIGIKLFGINQATTASAQTSLPLFKKLDQNGTLFIKNVQLLDIETQEHLAEYVKYGMYRMVKNDQKLPSNVRIICSTQQNIQMLIHDGSFSKNLYDALSKTTLTCPSITALPEHELLEIMDGFAEQAVKTQAFKNLLELTEKDKAKLIVKRPVSLYELKNKVQQALVQKSKKNQIYEETHFNPAYAITDPELSEAARLGKHALRDQKIMALLWQKFQNQNQIATFLGVNRSSVNRRCKDYNLE